MSSGKSIPCILVIEDERAIREMLVAFLKSGGYKNVVAAGNAEEAAFYIYKDAGLDIKLALVDLVLPNASGLTLIRKLRASKNPVRRKMPVIVLTGRTDTNTYRAAARRGIQGYLMKPVSAALLLDTVKGVLSNKQGPAGAEVGLTLTPDVAGSEKAAPGAPPPPEL